MADINIAADGCSSGYHAKHGQRTISFHAAQDCTVTFHPYPGNCFEVPSATVAKDWTGAVNNETPTTFTPSIPCRHLTTYDITFDSSVEHGNKTV